MNNLYQIHSINYALLGYLQLDFDLREKINTTGNPVRIMVTSPMSVCKGTEGIEPVDEKSEVVAIFIYMVSASVYGGSGLIFRPALYTVRAEHESLLRQDHRFISVDACGWS